MYWCKKMNNIKKVILLIFFAIIILLDLICSVGTVKEFPKLIINKENLLDNNKQNLKDFDLIGDGCLVSKSDDPWVFYSFVNEQNIKGLDIKVDFINPENVAASCFFITRQGEWIPYWFNLEKGINRITADDREFKNVTMIRFDFLSEKDASIKINEVIINNPNMLSLKYHVRSLVIALSITIFAILCKINKEQCYWGGTYMSFLLFIMCSAEHFWVLCNIFKVISILMFGLFLFNNSNKKSVKFEKTILLLFGTIFSMMMLMRGKLSGENETFNLFCVCVLVVMTIAWLAQNYYSIKVKRWLIENKAILLIIVCFVLLSTEVIDSWFMWDSWQYYARGSKSIKGILEIFNADFSGIYNIYLANHASIGYSLWVILFQLFRDDAVSVQCADIVLAAISIYAYYKILRKLFENRYSNDLLALAAMPYAFSPFVLGIIGNVNLDSATMYFAIIFMACSLYHFEYLELIFVFFFCFTKETAVIYYTSYIIVKILCEYFDKHKFSFVQLIKFGFSNFKNYVYAMPVVVWFILYKLNDSWGGDGMEDGRRWNYFGIDQNIILTKMKQIFFLNFNWIFWITIIIGGIFLCAKRIKVKKEDTQIIIPIGAVGMAVMGFGCIYVTYSLARYIVPVIPVIYLIAIWIIGRLKDKYIGGWSVFVSVLLLVQCFRMVDPVTANIFQAIPIGDNQAVYVVGNAMRFDDHIVYNRQNIYWSEALIEVLEHSGYDGNMLIVFPPQYFNQYNMLGNWECIWDTQFEELAYYDDDMIQSGRGKEVIVCSIDSDVHEKLLTMNSNCLLYIIPTWAHIDEDFISDKSLIKKGKVTHKGYDIQYMVMNV